MDYNGGKTSVEFHVQTDSACLAVLISKLNDLFPETDNRKETKINFREEELDTSGMVKYRLIELKTDEDLKQCENHITVG